MRAQVLLCDWAEVVGGKLYAQGIGWSAILADVPISIALGLVIRVDYNETNVEHVLELKLVDSDGHPYPDAENPVVMGFGFEVGRPPGMKAGEPQSVVLSSKVVGLSFKPGRYSWDLYYNGNQLPDSTTFTAMDRG